MQLLHTRDDTNQFVVQIEFDGEIFKIDSVHVEPISHQTYKPPPQPHGRKWSEEEEQSEATAPYRWAEGSR